MTPIELKDKLRNLEDENYRLKEELDYEMFSAREAFRIVVESNLDSIIGIDNNCNIILFNPAAEDMFQYIEKEVLFKPIEILFKEDVEDKYHEKLVRFLNEGIFERDILNKTTEVLLKRRDGSYFEGETSFAVGRGKTNLYIVLTIRDISYRKKIERQLIESEAKARTLLNTPHQSILLIDSKGSILDCNKGCRQLFIDEHIEPEGKSLFNCRNKNVNPELLSKIEWVFSSGEILRYEAQFDDEYFDNIIYPVLDKEGIVIETVFVSNNITDFIQEKKLFTSEESIYINRKLLSNFNHEFRTPISGSIGMINLLNNTNIDNQQKELISIIKDSSEYLLNIFNNFYDFLSLQKQNIILSNQNFNIKQTIEELVSTDISFKKTANVGIKTEFKEGIPEIIYADKKRYKQILGNIFFHAIRQINKGNILLSLSVAEYDNPFVCIKTEIKCSELLLSNEEIISISKVFNSPEIIPNNLIDFKETEFYISRILAELMDGKIDLINHGSNNFTFWFTIKVKIS